VAVADKQDLTAARGGLPWLTADAHGRRLTYHASRGDAAADANRAGGRVYQIDGNELRPLGG